jgi:uncharacterized paraquat-inducible protein A
VPWCDTCDRLVADDELVDGACPTCASNLVERARQPISWRFRLLILATVVYLIWRLVQGIQWVSHHA